MERKAHILVVDDDDRLRSLLKKFLSERGFMISDASDAPEARRKLAWFIFDLIVLDVMMPGESGLDLLKTLRENPPAPTLMLSAMGEADDRIKGLEIGAEDYVAKPFDPKELTLRIKSILRRAAPPKAKVVVFGDHRFDPESGQLSRGGEGVYLTSNELAILKRLAGQPGKPVSREELAKLTPGASGERAIDVQIARLRKKIGDEKKPVHLQTARGAGYALYAREADA